MSAVVKSKSRRSTGRAHGPVVQLVRTLACHARGRRFEPVPGRHYASVAQLVEQGTENPRVIGSIPIGGTNFADVAHLVERHLAKVEVASSSLVIRSRKKDFTFVKSFFLCKKSLTGFVKYTSCVKYGFAMGKCAAAREGISFLSLDAAAESFTSAAYPSFPSEGSFMITLRMIPVYFCLLYVSCRKKHSTFPLLCFDSYDFILRGFQAAVF